MISIIFAGLVREGHFVFGNSANNKMPWEPFFVGNKRLKNDTDRFKELTRSSAVVMGRRTFFSLGATPLVGRMNFVVSQARVDHPGVSTFRSLSDAIYASDEKEVFLLGGLEIYRDGFSHFADRLYLTEVFDGGQCHGDLSVSGGWFEGWDLIESSHVFPSDEENIFPVRFLVYDRPRGSVY